MGNVYRNLPREMTPGSPLLWLMCLELIQIEIDSGQTIGSNLIFD